MHLNKGANAIYRTQQSIAEFLTLIGSSIRKTTQHELESSPYISLLIDETTDLSTTKQLIVYAKYLCTTSGPQDLSPRMELNLVEFQYGLGF